MCDKFCSSFNIVLSMLEIILSLGFPHIFWIEYPQELAISIILSCGKRGNANIKPLINWLEISPRTTYLPALSLPQSARSVLPFVKVMP